ncbi:uncharacterized protein LOC117118568 [Anneissia japonica]|uniref:uncharacterized protein LOC117118568 n=1 Tax=Anneissia japonica TaxID=1529436 RepID=UPI0014259E14|nr:uncharacterized protein LOC117118568 [Anneissia japonica]
MAKSVVDHGVVGGSCSSSSVGLPSISLPHITHHPDSWTRVATNNMHLRNLHQVDPFRAWQCDIQSQISCISEKLRSSLEENPIPGTNVSPYAPVQHDFEETRLTYTRKTTPQLRNALTFGQGRA